MEQKINISVWYGKESRTNEFKVPGILQQTWLQLLKGYVPLKRISVLLQDNCKEALWATPIHRILCENANSLDGKNLNWELSTWYWLCKHEHSRTRGSWSLVARVLESHQCVLGSVCQGQISWKEALRGCSMKLRRQSIHFTRNSKM